MRFYQLFLSNPVVFSECLKTLVVVVVVRNKEIKFGTTVSCLGKGLHAENKQF